MESKRVFFAWLMCFLPEAKCSNLGEIFAQIVGQVGPLPDISGSNDDFSTWNPKQPFFNGWKW